MLADIAVLEDRSRFVAVIQGGIVKAGRTRNEMNEGDEMVGCEYCRDQASHLIDGLAVHKVERSLEAELLLECPRCGQYYVRHFPEDFLIPLTAAEAAAGFPDAFRPGRPEGSFQPCETPSGYYTSGTLSALTSMSATWRTSTAFALAQQMYDSRDFSAMPILADALEDAGCDNADILDHCRGPGPHVRGCWVVDLVLGKG